MVTRGGVQGRPSLAGAVALLVVVLVLGVRPVWLWTMSQLPVLAILNGLQMPGPLPALGVPLSEDPSWAQWGAQALGAVAIPVVFWLWMSRTPGGPGRVAVRGWAATVMAVIAGCLVHAVLSSILIPGGIVSFLLTVLGVVVLGAVVGVVLGVPVGLICALASLGGARAAGAGETDGSAEAADAGGAGTVGSAAGNDSPDLAAVHADPDTADARG